MATLFVLAAILSGRQAAADDVATTPQMQQQMQVHMQDMMVMQQNAAVWTPQGLVVLQGNRLLRYSPSMKLQQTVTLPIASTLAPVHKTNSRDYTSVGTLPDEVSSIRSRLAAQIITTADGLILVRGVQLIWLDKDFQVTGQAVLPELPPLTAAELAAICPPMPEGEMPMAGLGMPKMAGMGAQPTTSSIQQH